MRISSSFAFQVWDGEKPFDLTFPTRPKIVTRELKFKLFLLFSSTHTPTGLCRHCSTSSAQVSNSVLCEKFSLERERVEVELGRVEKANSFTFQWVLTVTILDVAPATKTTTSQHMMWPEGEQV